MPLDLTDADWAEIKHIAVCHYPDALGVMGAYPAIYSAGIAAGMKRAAKYCDSKTGMVRAELIAAAIRALL
jgi:hypothetical protein